MTELTAYRDGLKQRLSTRPSDNEAKGRALIRLYAVLASEAVPTDFADLRQMTYLETLSGSPVWAVERAVSMWLSGENQIEGENRNFVPKPAELMRLVRLSTLPVEKELFAISRTVEAAEIRIAEPSLEERARVAAGFDALKAELPSGQSRAAKSDAALSKLADENLRTLLRGLGKSEAEIADALNATPNAPARSDTFRRTA